MRGITQTLWIVIALVVLIVAALVVLTIFSTGVQNVASLTQAKAVCGAQGRASCTAAGSLPITWGVPNIRIQENNGVYSCGSAQVLNCNACPGSTVAGQTTCSF
jgi:hypothetical protein